MPRLRRRSRRLHSWTGFYIFGGGGGGLWAAEPHRACHGHGAAPLTVDQRQGGGGWFGTVGAGYDWQFNSTWVLGIFADGQFGSIRGTIQDPLAVLDRHEKMQDLGRRRPRRLPRCPERPVLRQRRLLRFALVGHEP